MPTHKVEVVYSLGIHGDQTFDEAADRVEEIWYEELEKAC